MSRAMNSHTEVRVNWPFLVLVSLLCLTGAAAGSYMLYSDLHGRGPTGSGVAVATVERQEAKVRHKLAKSYIWNEIRTGESIFLKDSIQTGSESAVSIRLKDGSLLDVGENSLIVMDHSANLSLGYLRGSVIVHKGKRESKITVGNDGKTQIEEFPVRLIQPTSLARFFLPERTLKQISFSWEILASGPLGSPGRSSDPVSLQISSSQRFLPQSTTELRMGGLPRASPQSVVAQLGPGKYFWRLVQKGKVLSEVKQFEVFNALPLQPTWPVQKQKVAISASDAALPMRWLSLKAAPVDHLGLSDNLGLSYGEHFIQLARDPAFKNAISSERITPSTGTTSLRNLPEGIIYWRIVSTYRDSTGKVAVQSGVQLFELTKRQDPAQNQIVLPPPEKAKPDPGAVLSLLDPKTVYEASWADVPGAVEYELTIGSLPKDGSPRKTIVQTKTQRTHFSLKSLPPGDYVWTVRPIDVRKHPGSPLQPRSFALGYGKILNAPELVSPEVQ